MPLLHRPGAQDDANTKVLTVGENCFVRHFYYSTSIISILYVRFDRIVTAKNDSTQKLPGIA